MTREELSQMVELLRDTAKLHQPNEEILTDVKAENFIFVMDSVLSALSVPEREKGEYIKKEDATKALSDHFMYLQRLKHDEGNGCKKYEQAGINWCLNTLNELPTYSFPDREKGTWKCTGADEYFCSVCHEESADDSDFCPNCGADMKGDKE